MKGLRVSFNLLHNERRYVAICKDIALNSDKIKER